MNLGIFLSSVNSNAISVPTVKSEVPSITIIALAIAARPDSSSP